jgi:outer membrane protein insertion porin family
VLNVTGQCDKIYFDTSFFSSQNNQSLLLGYFNPLLLRQHPLQTSESFDVRAYRTFHDRTDESAFVQHEHGGVAKYLRGAHEFQYECAWREVLLAKNPALVQFGDAGHTLKSSLRHELTLDGRDSRALPTRGAALSVAHELAGFGGNTRFFKHESVLQLNWALLPWLSLGVSGRFGAMAVPPTPANQLSPSDRFYLGGPTSFAGFAKHGVGGGSTRRAQLGGTAYWNVRSMLSCPLDALVPDIGDVFNARLHCFAQTGALAQPRAGAWHAINSDLASQYRTSVGFGIGASLGAARIEFNYALPLRASAFDRPEPIQFGVAVKLI